MLDKEKIKELYLKGHTSNQIAKILNCNSGKIRVYIHRNLKSNKTLHESEKIYRKEVDRITRHESKQFMSDKDFIKRNRSIYITKENGDIVIDKKVAGVVTFDTPRRLSNENKCII